MCADGFEGQKGGLLVGGVVLAVFSFGAAMTSPRSYDWGYVSCLAV